MTTQPTFHVRYHRRRSTTQTEHDDFQVAETGELWGRTGRYDDEPAVKAYSGRLPSGTDGIEFTTGLRPSSGPGRQVRWYVRDGANLRTVDGVDWATVPVTVIRIVQGGVRR